MCPPLGRVSARVDVVTKGTGKPYRIMTSRSEYRLLHRRNSADERLSAIGHRGLVSGRAFTPCENTGTKRAPCARLEKSARRPRARYSPRATLRR